VNPLGNSLGNSAWIQVTDSVRHPDHALAPAHVLAPAHALANSGRVFHDARIEVEPIMQGPRGRSRGAEAAGGFEGGGGDGGIRQGRLPDGRGATADRPGIGEDRMNHACRGSLA
jgi:hypothetical protein